MVGVVFRLAPPVSTTEPPDPADQAARALIPPPELRRRVSGTASELEYVRAAVEYATLLRSVGDLAAGDRVLEPGCGTGRVAAALTGYLRPPGAYQGFDIHRASIEFARRAFTPWPHFRFTHADIRTEYFLDPREHFAGQAVPPQAFRFPWPEAAFDYVFTVSLYTHMLPEGTAHFLAETGRVLRPGGRGFLSAWVLDHAGPGAAVVFQPVARPDGPEAPPVRSPWMALADPGSPTTGVACSLAFWDWALGRAGLRLRQIFPGGWSGARRGWLTLLDVLTFDRR
jgi:SAM-dependent methyltransferase